METTLAVVATTRNRRVRAAAARRRPDFLRALAGLPAPAGRAAAGAACAGLLAVEVVVSLSLWSVIPLCWLWIGGLVFKATGSLAADLGVVLLGFAATAALAMTALARMDLLWIELRRRTGRKQKEGALNQVVIASATLGLIGFALWFYVFSDAYIIPFMPSR
jgi:hypothetical protein